MYGYGLDVGSLITKSDIPYSEQLDVVYVSEFCTARFSSLA